MKHIPLTKGQFAIVDDEDYEFLSQWRWQAYHDKCTDDYYAITSIKLGDKWTRRYMHQILTKCPIGLIVDHKNRDGLDNRRNNLRVCTCTQNQQNRGLMKHNTSGVTGVNWNKQSKKWRARIKLKGKNIELGHYDDINEAIKVRKDKEKELGWYTNI